MGVSLNRSVAAVAALGGGGPLQPPAAGLRPEDGAA